MIKKYNIDYQHTNDIYIDKSNKLNFSGAGVLLFEEINNKWCLILVEDHTKSYADIGGTYENKHTNLENTAIEELREESRNLIHLLNYKYLTTYIDVLNKNNDTYYRSYLININGIKEYDFLRNVELITKYHQNRFYVKESWRETFALKKFYLSDLFDSINNSILTCIDINKNKYIIRKRLFDILARFVNEENLIKYIPTEVIKKRVIQKFKDDIPFLENTISYKIF